jgi:transketolase
MPAPAPTTDDVQKTASEQNTAQRVIDTIRLLTVDAVEEAQSGHPGMPMGMAPAAYVLWKKYLRHNPAGPRWPGRDRFVLSAGHGSMLLYSLLHLTGYDLSLEDLKDFRQWESKTPGHPENSHTPGVETTTGPLGQGFANGVGMALAEEMWAAKFNRDDFALFDYFVYGICSDGDLMEGISHEAASLAGHLGLGKLVYLYDDNDATIDGDADLAFSEDVPARFQSYGWHTLVVDDANDLDALDEAIQQARADTERPSLVSVCSQIGFGHPELTGDPSTHSDPFGEEAVRATKEALGFPPDEKFFVPEEAQEHMREAMAEGERHREEWDDLKQRYAEAHPEAARELDRWLDGGLPDDLPDLLPTFEAGEEMATRKASGETLDAIAPAVGFLIGGSADLTPSNKTAVEGRDDFEKDNRAGQYLRFGVREHGMAGVMNGMALSGLRPYGGTFLIFSDYLRPSLRLSALMEQPVTYVLTHDSVGLGEDGPTHQPVEHLAALRAIPNLTLIRPADAGEAAVAWQATLENTGGPTALALTRQGVPTLERAELAPAEGLLKGGYVLSDDTADGGAPDLILIGTGSEVQHALGAACALREEEGWAVRVVSMPSWELFEDQPERYRRAVLPPACTRRVSVEAGVTQGWARYVGTEGASVGIDRFGASAPGATNMEKFGFTAENVARAARTLF